jgi:hypothetical protein
MTHAGGGGADTAAYAPIVATADPPVAAEGTFTHAASVRGDAPEASQEEVDRDSDDPDANDSAPDGDANTPDTCVSPAAPATANAPVPSDASPDSHNAVSDGPGVGTHPDLSALSVDSGGHGAQPGPPYEYVFAGHVVQLTGPPVCAQALSAAFSAHVIDGPAKPGRHAQV